MTPQSHPRLVEDLLADGLLDEPERDGPKRITLVSPLARLPCEAASPLDAFALAERIEAAVRTVEGLPPKCAVVLDDGGPPRWTPSPGIFASWERQAGQLVLGLPAARWYGPLAEAEAPALVAAILRRFAALRRAAPERIRRLRDLPAEALAGLVGLPEAAALPARPRRGAPGLFPQGDGHVTALIGLPFGRSRAETWPRWRRRSRTSRPRSGPRPGAGSPSGGCRRAAPRRFWRWRPRRG